MPKFVTMPDGEGLNLDLITGITASGTTLTVKRGATGDYTFNASNAAGAAALRDRLLDPQLLDGAVLTDPSAGAVLATAVLISILPAAFDLATDTITITGLNFRPETIGTLWFENDDIQDSNGYSMACTYVSPTQITGVFASSGDGILTPPPVIIYYQDSNGVKSNNLAASNPSGTQITIP